MADIVVTPVRSRRDRWAFVELPWSLYRNDPNWIPPLRDHVRELAGFKHHPFHDEAEVQTFLARRGKRVVGRVAAILNHAHNKQHNERIGFFGFFESIEDQEVATALLDAVQDWLAERDITHIRGPANPSVNYEIGLLVDGFDSPPTFMMTYNPPYYEQMITACGYEKSQDLLSFLGILDQLPEVQARYSEIAEMALERTGATIRSIDRGNFLKEVEGFLELYNLSFVQMWGFVPMSPGEVQHTAAALRHLLIPELTLIAEVDGTKVGCVFALPDFNPTIKKIDGRLYPTGFLHLIRAKHRVRRVRVLSINVVPEYQRWGLGLSLMNALVPKSLDSGLEEAEFSWVAESNSLARQALQKGGAKLEKTYRMYDKVPTAG